jgi:hypothetical protein
MSSAADNGYNDFNGIKTDADLAPLRGTELDLLLFKFQNPVSQALGPVAGLFGGNKKANQGGGSKPWILW